MLDLMMAKIIVVCALLAFALSASPQAPVQHPARERPKSVTVWVKGKKPASDTIVTGPWIEFKPTPNKGFVHWIFLRSHQGGEQNPLTTLLLTVGKRDILIARNVSGNVDVIDRGTFSIYEVPAKAVTACTGWYAGSGDTYWVTKRGRRLRVYHRSTDETDQELQHADLVKTVRF